MMWGYNGFAGGWGMGLGMLLFWGAVIFAVVMLARALGGASGMRCGAHQPFGARSAIDVLRERYAKGEIDKRDFEERLADLERSGARR